jgi:ATP-dependent DNA helicase PIF1
MQTNPIITDEFAHAFDILEKTRNNIFLTGKAGTGKSTFLQYFRETTKKNIAIVAPTGVAALNVNAQTIHSLFRFAPRFINPDEIRTDKRALFRQLELLIIDEISMVRADIFDAIDVFLKKARRNNKPFGGVQICAIGDLFQLPPVVSNDEQEFFQQYYDSPYFFAAKIFAESYFTKIEFQKVHRQSDTKFINILNAIRSGECSEHNLNELNQKLHTSNHLAAGELVLTATNAIADNINQANLRNLTGNAKTYSGEINGNFGLKDIRLPAAENLVLKCGAQVMFVRNDAEGKWVNGTIGVVEELSDDIIKVRTESGVHEVEQKKWQTISYEFSEEEQKIVEKVLGSYKQFPLMLAWAVTIHKSQGKTLEKVIIDLGRGAFAPGQLYVALSRCKTLEGITLKRPLSIWDSVCDQRVIDFMSNNN